MLAFNFYLHDETVPTIHALTVNEKITIPKFATLTGDIKGQAVRVEIIAYSQESLQKAIELLIILKMSIK